MDGNAGEVNDLSNALLYQRQVQPGEEMCDAADLGFF